MRKICLNFILLLTIAFSNTTFAAEKGENEASNKAADTKKYYALLREKSDAELNKDYEKYFKLAEEAIKLRPNNYMQYIERARVYRDIKNYDSAIADYKTAKDLTDGGMMYMAALNFLAETYLEKGEKDLARAYAENALQSSAELKVFFSDSIQYYEEKKGSLSNPALIKEADGMKMVLKASIENLSKIDEPANAVLEKLKQAKQ